MQLNDTHKMAKDVITHFKNNLGSRIEDYVIFNVVDDRNHRAFSINFDAYGYFRVLFNYDKGRMGCSIQYGEQIFIGLQNSQKWYEKADFDIFCKELQEELELRIPDKFLEAKGWR